MRDAMRSGWNGSKSSGFSPTPTNLIGLPVVVTTERAAPPRASPSVFVRMMPVRGSASANPAADFTASWPVIASATNRISCGSTAAATARISAIRASSTCRRPAVSTMTVSRPVCFASRDAVARDLNRVRARPGSNTGTPICLPRVTSCCDRGGPREVGRDDQRVPAPRLQQARELAPPRSSCPSPADRRAR